MLGVKVHPYKGRGLYTNRLVQRGEIVLQDQPLLLTVSSERASKVCAFCLRLLKQGAITCPACQQCSFCNPDCASAAASALCVHSPQACRALMALTSASLNAEENDGFRYLLQLSCLRASQLSQPGSSYQQLQELGSIVTADQQRLASKLHPMLAAALGADVALMSVDDMAKELAREQHNSYGILLQPSDPSTSGRGHTSGHTSGHASSERKLRGSGVYLMASLINHECCPNVARFDYFDRPGPGNSSLMFRALHDLPAGTEVTQSYVPINWSYRQRQRQLRDVFHFTCNCSRCQTEGMADNCSESSGEWETDSEGEGEEEEEVEMEACDGSADHQHEVQDDADEASMGTSPPTHPPDEPPHDSTYIQLYLLKYLCPQRKCFGTLAPMPDARDVYECNICGHQRTEAEFMAEVEGGA